MSKFRFELEALLTYRKHQRDQCRQLLGEVQAEQAACRDEQASGLEERELMMQEIRSGHIGGGVNVSRLASIRYYIGQIDLRQRSLELQLQRYEQQLELCRRALMQADMAVKALEQLRDQRRQDFTARELKRAELELQEAWSGISRQNR